MLPVFIDTIETESIISDPKHPCANSTSKYDRSFFVNHGYSVTKSTLGIRLRLRDYLLHYIFIYFKHYIKVAILFNK